MPLRLAGNGSSATDGYIEVFDENNKKWGNICKTSFNIIDAHVVCNMLGFYTAMTASTNTAEYDLNDPHFVLDDLNCDGTETSVFDCPVTGESNGQCDASEVAGVECSESKL